MPGRHPHIAFVLMASMCSTMVTSGVMADESRQQAIELKLPRPAGTQEALRIQVRTGALARGKEIRISTPDGMLLGTVSPYGATTLNQQGATYTIPVPKEAIGRDRVQLRLEVDEPDKPSRAPRPSEVESIDLIYVPVTD